MEKSKRDEKEWRRQELEKKRREEKRKKAIKERRCFVYGIFGHIAHYYRNRREEESVQMPLNKFEVLKSKEMQKGEGKGKEMREVL